MNERIVNRGDVYWVNPNPTSGREIKGHHRYVSITTKAVNQYDIVTMVPITSGGNFARSKGFAVPISGYDTTGVALCNQPRSFDINSRVKAGSAKYIETLDQSVVEEILDRVVSILDPEELR